MKHFLTTDTLSRAELEDLLDLSDEFVDVLARPIPKVPALRGRTVAMLFFEPSTRTRMSFERAAKALSADTMSFSPGTSSLSKGESLKDTALTIKAMGAEALVVRHKSTGAPWRIADWTGLPVLNGGDGAPHRRSSTRSRYEGTSDLLTVSVPRSSATYGTHASLAQTSRRSQHWERRSRSSGRVP